MKQLIKKIDSRVNHVIWSFITTGIILIALAIVTVWVEWLFRFLVALFILLVAYTFIYAGYKLWSTKKEIKDYLNIK